MCEMHFLLDEKSRINTAYCAVDSFANSFCFSIDCPERKGILRDNIIKIITASARACAVIRCSNY